MHAFKFLSFILIPEIYTSYLLFNIRILYLNEYFTG